MEAKPFSLSIESFTLHFISEKHLAFTKRAMASADRLYTFKRENREQKILVFLQDWTMKIKTELTMLFGVSLKMKKKFSFKLSLGWANKGKIS